jgi:LEA14-like dessication related protein
MIMFLLVACGGGGSALASFVPTVKFNRLELTDIDFENLSVDFVFDVHNPNPVDLPLERFAYGLDLAEIEILTGNSPDGILLREEATSEMVLPVSLNFNGIYELATADRGVDDMPFRLVGGFGWDTDIGPVDINFDETGEFPALRVPDIKIGELLVSEVTDTQAGFVLDVDVDNDHATTLDFANLDFKVKFAGVQVGVGSQDEFGTVEGATTKKLSVPFAVNYFDAVDALLALAAGEKLKVDLKATSDVTTPFGLIPMSIDEDGNVDVVSEE